MKVLVENCFSWLGFHIISNLLENGYTTDGVDDTSTEFKEHLSMLVGRNALFRHISDPERENNYDRTITIKENKLVMNHGDDQTTVKLPVLFGEWMPMNENGIYRNGRHIPFDSDIFQNNAVYVGDFAISLVRWMEASQLPEVLDVNPTGEGRAQDIKLENSVYIRNNIPIKEKVSLVQNHYKQFRKIYQCH